MTPYDAHDMLSYMAEPFEKHQEIASILNQIDLLRIAVVRLGAKPGRPKGSRNRWRPTPIVLEDVRRWVKPDFSVGCKDELKAMLQNNEVKRLTCAALFMKFPHKNAKELQDWLIQRHGMRVKLNELADALTELRMDGLVLRIDGFGWINYWENHADNRVVDGMWTEPTQWTKPNDTN